MATSATTLSSVTVGVPESRIGDPLLFFTQRIAAMLQFDTCHSGHVSDDFCRDARITEIYEGIGLPFRKLLSFCFNISLARDVGNSAASDCAVSHQRNCR